MELLRCESIYAERPVKVICIGAGASGLLLAYKLKKHCNNSELTVSSHTLALANFADSFRYMRRTAILRALGMNINIQGKFYGQLRAW